MKTFKQFITESKYTPHTYHEVRQGGKKYYVQHSSTKEHPKHGKLHSGFRVDEYGQKTWHSTKTHDTSFLHVYTDKEIKRTLKLNKHYGMLEEPDE